MERIDFASGDRRQAGAEQGGRLCAPQGTRLLWRSNVPERVLDDSLAESVAFVKMPEGAEGSSRPAPRSREVQLDGACRPEAVQRVLDHRRRTDLTIAGAASSPARTAGARSQRPGDESSRPQAFNPRLGSVG